MLNLNHNIFNTRNFTIAGILIVGVFLSWLVVRSCASTVDTTEAISNITDIQEALKLREHKSDSIAKVKTAENQELQTENVSLRKQIEAYQKQSGKMGGQVRDLTRQLQDAKVNHDTTAFVQSCDSIAQLATDQQSVIQHQDMLMDSTFANYEKQLSNKDTVLENRAQLIAQLKSTNDTWADELVKTYKGNEKLQHKLKTEKTISRVLAAILLVGGTIIIASK